VGAEKRRKGSARRSTTTTTTTTITTTTTTIHHHSTNVSTRSLHSSRRNLSRTRRPQGTPAHPFYAKSFGVLEKENEGGRRKADENQKIPKVRTEDRFLRTFLIGPQKKKKRCVISFDLENHCFFRLTEKFRPKNRAILF
jgi:hypothetical protein